MLPAARVTARPVVVGTLTHNRWPVMTSVRAAILVAAPVAARRTVTLAAVEPRAATPVEALRIVTSVVEPHTVVILEQAPRMATQAVTSVVELHAVVILAQAPRTVTQAVTSVVEPHAVVTLPQLPRAVTQAVTSVVEPHAVVILPQLPRAVTLVAALREAIRAVAVGTIGPRVTVKARPQ
ncbi:MAG: hypothetical protein JWL65_716 [Gammaproteobacteria bacterium]|nr:hypothetical protein [Gammaproteobacteria bacterium]